MLAKVPRLGDPERPRKLSLDRHPVIHDLSRLAEELARQLRQRLRYKYSLRQNWIQIFLEHKGWETGLRITVDGPTTIEVDDDLIGPDARLLVSYHGRTLDPTVSDRVRFALHQLRPKIRAFY